MNALALTLAMLAAAPGSDDEIATLGASLAALRAEVDGLSADVAGARGEAKEEQLGFARRRAALEGDLEGARLLATELRGRIDAMEQAQVEKTTAAALFEAPLRDVARRLRRVVTSGAPFQVRARLDRIAALEASLDANPGDAAAALAALEPILVDEAQLARTTARARMPIVVNGEQVVADIVRVGTLAVLFRSPKGAVGYAAHGGARGGAHDGAPGGAPDAAFDNVGVWRVLDDDADRALVQEIFDLYRNKPPDRVLLVPRAALPAMARVGGAP